MLFKHPIPSYPVRHGHWKRLQKLAPKFEKRLQHGPFEAALKQLRLFSLTHRLGFLTSMFKITHRLLELSMESIVTHLART